MVFIITALVLLTFGAIIFLNKKCPSCKMTKYSTALLNGIVYVIQAIEAVALTIKDGYYENMPFWLKILSFSPFLIGIGLAFISGVYWIPFGISVGLISIGVSVYKLIVKMTE